MYTKKGFSWIEIVIILAVVAFGATLILVQKYNLEAMARDNQRKIAVNAVYYALEESFYPAHGYYPESISPSVLPVVDPELWEDPEIDFYYAPVSCNYEGHCSAYTIKTELEKEDTYIKKNK